jgi:hypothetical protein
MPKGNPETTAKAMGRSTFLGRLALALAAAGCGLLDFRLWRPQVGAPAPGGRKRAAVPSLTPPLGSVKRRG